ncbi:MAG: SDR family oxidoreductase [Candidatus Abyssubacteria bacterium]
MEIFANKTSIVTGAASGIGRALSGELARCGACVTLADSNAGLLEETARGLSTGGHRTKSAVVDVTDAAAMKRLIEETAADAGRVDYVFNNAGVVVFGEAQHFSYEDWRRVIDTNLYGVVNGVAAAYPIMLKQGFGHIVNTASLAGLVPVPGLISYVASKYGVVGLSNALRVEGARFGVKVSVVCPGLIDTPMKNSKVLKLDREKLLAAAGRLLSPDKCARVILRGVKRNKATITVTPMAKIMWLLQRMSPEACMWIWRQQAKRLSEIRLAD